jgi:hypothetical protein
VGKKNTADLVLILNGVYQRIVNCATWNHGGIRENQENLHLITVDYLRFEAIITELEQKVQKQSEEIAELTRKLETPAGNRTTPPPNHPVPRPTKVPAQPFPTPKTYAD